MQNRHDRGGFAGDFYSRTSNCIVSFPSRRRYPPPTISQVVAAYRARRFLRPGALSPLPEDLR